MTGPRDRPGGCPQQDCLHTLKGGPCNLGEADPEATCDVWKARSNAEGGGSVEPSSTPLPWTGGVFGRAEAGVVTARGRPRILGLVGHRNAGKSTALVTFYLQLCRGVGVAGRTFAGSYTLRGWDELASPLRLPPNGSGRGFPLHTTLTGREPGLLHLAFRRDDGRLEDILIADTPGEWFEAWADDSNSSPGAHWVVQHSDALALFVDSDALAGEEAGRYRGTYKRLARRTAESADRTPITVVWSKADVNVNSDIRESIARVHRSVLPDADKVAVTVRPTGEEGAPTLTSVVSLFEHLLAPAPRRLAAVRLPVLHPKDPFLAYRG